MEVVTLLLVICVPVLIVTTLVVLANLLFAPVIDTEKSYNQGHDKPPVTICIPARNEEATIGYCLESVLSQDYPSYDVLVLDDSSHDNTARIVKTMKKKFNNLQLLTGKELPGGWTGKNHACHQLGLKAKGDLLLFLDADCFLAPGALNTTVNMMKHYRTGLLSSFPTQVTRSRGEQLIVPIMNWILLTFLPLRMIYLSPWLSLTAANGQFMLFDRHVYDTIGGHASVKNRVVEDMELARLVKQHRFRMMTAAGGNGVFCHMYNSLEEGIAGFSKNFFPGFNTSFCSFSMLLLFITTFYLLPFLLPLLHPLLLVLPLLIMAQRTMISIVSRENPVINMATHPIQMILAVVVGINSMILAKGNRITWKGRTISTT